MRLAIISDLHLGDEHCQLAPMIGGKPAHGTTERLRKLQEAIGGKVDYLILAGDVLDFSIASYEEAFAAARQFFGQIQNMATSIIYLPGNHDFDIWHTVEYEVNIIKQVSEGGRPRLFRWSVPAVIDDRAGARNPEQILPSVRFRKGDGYPYGGLFLDKLLGKEGGELNFMFAYPNLYLITPEGATILVTHGQYFDGYWSMTLELLSRVCDDDLKVSTPPSLEQVAAVNFPLSQLACSGVGQSGPLTEVVKGVLKEVKVSGAMKKLDRTITYLDRAGDIVRNDLLVPKGILGGLGKMLIGFAWGWVRGKVINGLEGLEPMRNKPKFLTDKDVRVRFKNYLASSGKEIEALNHDYHRDIPEAIDYVIFGHTHERVPWKPDRPPNSDFDFRAGERTVRLFNTGGWINKDVGDNFHEFTGATVFLYSTEGGMRSVDIS